MILKKFKKQELTTPDDFSITERKIPSKESTHLILNFIRSFCATMSRKYDYLVFVDLVSDSGYLREGKDIYMGISLSVLSEELFSKYIYVVEDNHEYNALNIRVKQQYSRNNVLLFNNTLNESIKKITPYIPETNAKNKVSGLALITLNEYFLDFENIESLFNGGMNLLITIQFKFRNQNDFKKYLKDNAGRIKQLMGVERLGKEQGITDNLSCFRVLAKLFHQKINSLGYNSSGSFKKVNHDQDSLMFIGSYFIKNEVKKVQTEFNNNINTQVSLFQ